MAPILRSILPVGKGRGKTSETELTCFGRVLVGSTEPGNPIPKLWHSYTGWEGAVENCRYLYYRLHFIFFPQPPFNGGFMKYSASPQKGNYRDKFTQQFSCTYFVSQCFLPSFFPISLLSSKWFRIRMFFYSLKRDKICWVCISYILDIPHLQHKYVHADSFGCAKVFWADLNIEILRFLDMDKSDGKKSLHFGIPTRIITCVSKAWLNSCQCVKESNLFFQLNSSPDSLSECNSKQ